MSKIRIRNRISEKFEWIKWDFNGLFPCFLCHLENFDNNRTRLVVAIRIIITLFETFRIDSGHKHERTTLRLISVDFDNDRISVRRLVRARLWSIWIPISPDLARIFPIYSETRILHVATMIPHTSNNKDIPLERGNYLPITNEIRSVGETSSRELIGKTHSRNRRWWRISMIHGLSCTYVLCIFPHIVELCAMLVCEYIGIIFFCVWNKRKK